MSSASNLGYSRQDPYTSGYVNGTSSTYSGNFTSKEVPGFPGIPGIKNNVHAASMSGGARRLKRKIKNIVKQYKTMKSKSRKVRAIKRKFMSRKRRRGRSHKRRHYKGGYSQYQNNMPYTPGYQAAGIELPASQSALANPVPITRLGDQVNGIDNYNHYTNMGFPSKGH